VRSPLCVLHAKRHSRPLETRLTMKGAILKTGILFNIRIYLYIGLTVAVSVSESFTGNNN